ncbi:hypothetical protein FRC12_017271 [Ceratobasidium sp. 428]|nr:hypothetical protein FRC12_017271 [Ceratobasidium sp. 428]
MCYVQGILPATGGTTRYVPLTPPGANRGLPPRLLIRRTHNLFLHHYVTLDALDGFPARRRRAAQELGINSRPIFASLKSIDLANCAPYDAMHLLFENLIPNMILHWIGKFKAVDQGRGHYKLDTPVWERIGELTEACAKTIPSAFVGTIPDIADQRHLFKAEGYSFWAQYIAPILLKDRLSPVYYNHFLLMREIIIRCVQYNITVAEVNELEEMVNRWVAEYERLYYQYQDNRLSTCPLTIHALLHIPMYIRETGPLCNSWAFVMERFCGRLLPAVKNRTQPYEHLNNYISRRAQMQAACHIHGLPTLPRSTTKWRYNGRERLSSHEIMYEDFPHAIVGSPTEVIRRIDFFTLVRHGRFRLTDDGDRVRTARLVERSENHRDNSFVRYDLNPDANARFRNRRDRPVRRTYYGRVLDVYYLKFIEDIENNTRRPYLLVRILECQTGGRDAALPENPQVKYDRIGPASIIHIDTINAVVGRVQLNRNTWAIVDQSRHGARTQFVDEEEDDD